MDGVHPEAQLAIVSLFAALVVGGPVALAGAYGILRAARLVATLILRGKILASIGLVLTVGLLGGLGFLGATVSVDSVADLLARGLR